MSVDAGPSTVPAAESAAMESFVRAPATATSGMPPRSQDIATETVGDITVDNPRMRARGVDVFYAEKQAILDVSLDIGQNEVVAMIGPSGCGKSTFLRCLNRMNDIIDVCRVRGRIELDGEDI